MSSSVRCLALLATGLLHVACGGEAERDSTPEGLRMLEAHLGVNCMPPSFGDSSSVSIEVEYSNSSDVDQTWTVGESRIELSNESEHETISFRFAPETTGTVLPGERLVIRHEKPPGSASSVQTCGYCSDGRWELFVSWIAPDGRVVEKRAGAGDVGCIG